MITMKNLKFEVEWEDGYLWIMEENGSGCKYECDVDEISKYVDSYVQSIVFCNEYEQKEANRDVY